ncbi:MULTISPECIES: dUTP diphosphatase [unclassified Ensifer]|uniref:dUTP diphosphatase n=1 Tax=unclassified Ensifer TaxID=2633371 RepID=UPI000813D752|nr:MULTISPECIES: dUTP diphosphatase [unclassified Ensifer]OCP21985.1 hypothetical protein BC361_25800 [Ensifer sp. LC54]OCP23235.1 hypothetical protein BC363_24965 [Ensifer sp. LC384]
MRIGFKALHPDAVMPKYANDQAAGADLVANIKLTLNNERFTEFTLDPGERKLIKTGVALEMPPGIWAEVRGRSGLAYNQGIAILGGTIDSDYRGDIGVIMLNTGDEPFVVKHGERIAQLVVETYVRGHFVEKAELRETARGEGGFGSTGMAA